MGAASRQLGSSRNSKNSICITAYAFAREREFARSREREKEQVVISPFACFFYARAVLSAKRDRENCLTFQHTNKYEREISLLLPTATMRELNSQRRNLFHFSHHDIHSIFCLHSLPYHQLLIINHHLNQLFTP